MVLRSGRAVGAWNPYVRAGFITAAGLMAARAGLRAYRRRRKGIGNIGKPRGTSTSKRIQITNTNAYANTRTLYDTELTEIDKGSTDRIDQRIRDMSYISGFKICIEALNKTSDPIYLNVAVVHDKRSNDTSTLLGSADFFRGMGSSRAREFGIALTANEFHCLPLNVDRFTVLYHSRSTLAPKFSGTTGDFVNNRGKNYINIDKWVKLKRQIRYESNNAQSKVWLIWWCDKWGAPAMTPVANDVIDFNHRVVTYFREPK